MQAGFIGLGNLGKSMVQRLLSEGIRLMVWNRTKEKASGLDVEIKESPSALVSEADIVFINVFDSAAVRSVMLGDSGLLQGNCNGKIIIDTTTNHFEDVLYFYAIAKEYGAYYLESPVLGSVVPALQGALTVLVSGEQEAYSKALRFIQIIGKKIFFLENPGLATKMKLINNLVLGSFMVTLSEAIAFGERTGIAKEQVIDVLSSGAGNSLLLNAKKQKLIEEDFSTHFSSALIYKDLHYMQDLAKTMKRPLFTGSTAKELFGLTFSKDISNLDFSGIYRIIREL